jgi:hypothetical protein
MNDMTPERPISETRAEEYETAMQFSTLQRHPHLQPERIARHYLSHASIAEQILKAEQMRRGQCHVSNPQLDQMVDSLISIIKANHRLDFGIELCWDVATLSRQHLIKLACSNGNKSAIGEVVAYAECLDEAGRHELIAALQETITDQTE